jgi:transcriptional regulator with XRE-family HTH domain
MNMLGTRIKEARKRSGLTVLGLAIEIRKAPQTIYGWEREVYTPTVQNLAAVAKALGITMDDLVFGGSDDDGRHENEVSPISQIPLPASSDST